MTARVIGLDRLVWQRVYRIAEHRYAHEPIDCSPSTFRRRPCVPTLITGYYGMNVPYPGSGSTTGVGVSTVLAVGLPVGLFLYFRRRDWL